MPESEAAAGTMGNGYHVDEEQIIALVGSRAPEDVRAAAVDALITTDVQLDRRMILPTAVSASSLDSDR